jgi:hypothetical protein
VEYGRRVFWRDRDVEKMMAEVVTNITTPMNERQSEILKLLSDNLSELDRIKLEAGFAERIGRIEATLEALDSRLVRLEERQG